MIYSVMLTGVAMACSISATRPATGKAHFDGLPVGFVAEAVTTRAEAEEGFCQHVMNPHDDGIGIDEYADWLIEAGYPDRTGRGLLGVGAALRGRFAGAAGATSQNTVLCCCSAAVRRVPGLPAPPNPARGLGFHRAVPGRGPRGLNRCGGDIPHVTPEVITRYATDLEALGLL